jgi:hypothetical protein
LLQSQQTQQEQLQQLQQLQQHDRQQEVASSLPVLQSIDADGGPLEQQQQVQAARPLLAYPWQQREQQQPLLQDLIARQQQQQQQAPPCFTAAGSASGSGSGSASLSGSARVNSWTFERCNSFSGFSFSETFGRRVRVHCATFNMNGKLPASLPPDLLGDCGALRGTGDGGGPDVLAFATQVRACFTRVCAPPQVLSDSSSWSMLEGAATASCTQLLCCWSCVPCMHDKHGASCMYRPCDTVLAAAGEHLHQ